MSRTKTTADDLLTRIEDEVRRLRSGDDWKRWLKAAAVFHNYSFGNVLLIQMQRPDATQVAGYGAWQKLGRQVNRGETGISILAPCWSRKPLDADSEVQAGPQDRDGKAGKTSRPRRLIGFRPTRVFDVSQTSGEALAEPPTPQPVVGQVPPGLWDALASEVRSAGFTLTRESSWDTSVEGYTDHDRKKVVVATHVDEVTAVARLAHEVTHMRMHSPDDVLAAGSIVCHGAREVEAESVAFVVLAHHGLEVETSSFPYIAGWAATVDRKAPEKVLQATGRRVVEMARQLIDSTDIYRSEKAAVVTQPELAWTLVQELRREERDPMGPSL